MRWRFTVTTGQRLMFIQLLSYLSFGLCMANLTPFLMANGLDIVARGMVLSGYALVNIFLQVTMGYLSDRMQSSKWLVIGTTICYGALVSVVFAGHMNQIVWLGLAVAMIGGLLNTLCAMQDTWFFAIDSQTRQLLPTIKAGGSVGWVIGSFSSAVILSLGNYFAVGIVCAVLTVLIVFTMWQSPDIQRQVGQQEKIKLSKVLSLLRERTYRLTIIIAFLLYALVVANTGLIVEKMLSLSASQWELSFKWAMGALLEVPMYLLWKRYLAHRRMTSLLRVSAIATIVQFTLFFFATANWQIIAICVLQLFTTPIILIVSKMLIAHIVPEQYQNSGQLIALSIFIGGSSLLVPIVTNTTAQWIGINLSIILLLVLPIMALYYIRQLSQLIDSK